MIGNALKNKSLVRKSKDVAYFIIVLISMFWKLSEENGMTKQLQT